MSCQSLLSPGAVTAPSTARGFAGGRRAPPSRSHRSGDLLQPQICEGCSAGGVCSAGPPHLGPENAHLQGRPGGKQPGLVSGGVCGGEFGWILHPLGCVGEGESPPAPAGKHGRCAGINTRAGKKTNTRGGGGMIVCAHVCTCVCVCELAPRQPRSSTATYPERLHLRVRAHACWPRTHAWVQTPRGVTPCHLLLCPRTRARGLLCTPGCRARSVRPHAGARPLGADGRCRGWGASGSPGSLRPDALITPGCKPHSRPHSWRSHPSGAAASCHPPAIAPTPPGSGPFGDGIRCGRQRAESVRRVRRERAKKAGSVQGANSGCGV